MIASDSSASPDDINVRWLIMLRWGAIAGQVALLFGAAFLLDLAVFWGPVVSIVVVEVVTNLVARRGVLPASVTLRVLMLLDIALFSALLAFTGGANNPFNFLSLIYIALAAVVLPSGWSWSLAALSFAGYGLLFLISGEVSHVHLMKLHLQGMWLAFGVAALFIVYFVHRVTRELARRESQLQQARARAEKSQRLSALATLAAGAAHELSTPLSTIAVIVKDLKVLPESTDDVQLIRQQVARCAELLRQLAADVGATQGEVSSQVTLGELVDAATQALPDAERVHRVCLGDGVVFGPPRALAQALRALVRNALQASSKPVEVRFVSRAAGPAIEVVDKGAGMSPETLSRAGEPFFTTKEPGEGTGLGLFLTRSVVEQLDGRLEFESVARQGTCARIVLPHARLHQRALT